MKNISKKLLIWDFDGVIADTEKLWLQTRMELLNQKFGLQWDMPTTIKFLAGMSDKTKQQVLNQMGIAVDDDFNREATQIDMQKIFKGIMLTPGIEDIFKMTEFEQCIATGGVAEKTEVKINAVGIAKYFPMSRVFTADLVEHGKPEPDLFLLAAQTMGYLPQDCIVIEDSLAGLTAALRAKMLPIAFIGSDLYGSTHVENIKKLGISHIFTTMPDIKKFLQQKYT